ncbi:MAG: SAM-dependent chlorinase/fluorinase [Gammaproteobacteria bacterium]|nr:SAM-dependent chlorinase/fluorinase [Gammaproteobacteria bacterium]
MIVLFTDFGLQGPYVGQIHAVLRRQLARQAPDLPIIDLFHDAPRFDPRASAYLLAAYVNEFAPGTVFLAVVDPGVGSEQRQPVVLEIDGRWFVGPDNGLFDVVARRGDDVQRWEITWRPENLSHSFHGRDLFAPVAAGLVTGRTPQWRAIEYPQPFSGPEDWPRLIYIDHFGNAMTGLRAKTLPVDAALQVGPALLTRARTFADVPVGEGFWYENANGLAEIAINQGSAVVSLGLQLGGEVDIICPG